MYVCQDCGISGEHLARTGCVPKRCADCRRALQNSRTKTYYQANREGVKASQRERWRQQNPPPSRTRECSRCGAEYERCQSPLCVECRTLRIREIKAAYRARNRERLRVVGRLYMRERYATDSEFAERQREYARARNGTPERRVIQQRAYWRNPEGHRARRRLAYNGARFEIYDRDSGLCHICGRHVPYDEYEIDHIVPVSRGGSSERNNLATSHMRCNRRKAARLIEEMVYG